MKSFDRPFFESMNQGCEREWFLTNGLGGYCSSSLILCPTRKQHGLLVSTATPPVHRSMILSAIDETLQTSSMSYPLVNRRYKDRQEDHLAYLDHVEIGDCVTYHYQIQDMHLSKTIAMVYEKNTVAIEYHLEAGEEPVTLKLTPLLMVRDHNGVQEEKEMRFGLCAYSHALSVIPINHKDQLVHFSISDGVFEKEEHFLPEIYYALDDSTGGECYDTGYQPGHWSIMLEAGESKDISFVCSLEESFEKEAHVLIQKEKERKQALITSTDDTMALLEKIADCFIVKRASTKGKTIIAGYPLFADWGRDTLIALEGLTLVTKRFEDARSILKTFAATMHKGLCVNMFPENGQEPLYNTVDASLWFIQCAYAYYQYTSDIDFIRDVMYEPMKEIIIWYTKGTEFDIYMDNDFLLHAGSSQDQITWMDVRINGLAVTPRHGKPVEINALWYNALCIMAFFSKALAKESDTYEMIAQKIRTSFRAKFFKGEMLLDVADPDDSTLRPNQLYALSLPFTMFSKEEGLKIFETVSRKLYVGRGLRSLTPDDPLYKGHYEGNMWKRDHAYHQGTAWGFLIGPYCLSYYRLTQDKEGTLELLQPLINSLYDGCINGISEIFDGDAPHQSRGSCNQAWSVGEVLHVLGEIHQEKR